MNTKEFAIEETRERLALRFLHIGNLIRGAGKRSRLIDTISPRRCDQLHDEAEWIGQRLNRLDRLDAEARKPHTRTYGQTSHAVGS
jgi:hypothetical protein